MINERVVFAFGRKDTVKNLMLNTNTVSNSKKQCSVIDWEYNLILL